MGRSSKKVKWVRKSTVFKTGQVEAERKRNKE
jgi:hypothetical protein